MVATIVDIERTRKCPLALVSIAPSYAALPVPEHVLDIGGKGWIGVDVVAKLTRCDAELDRKPKHIDELLALVPYEMRAENSVIRAINNDL